MRVFPFLAVGAVAVALVAGGPTASARTSASLTVYAAASLIDVFPTIDSTARYSFAGSNTLATQITNGAPADVFASANTWIAARLYAKGLVSKPVLFTRNTLVIVVPKSNPANIHSVYDLTKPGVKIDVANSAVPVGSYTLQILKNMNLTAKVTANIVSQETDVRGVLGKVALGQADAGFVYSTDAKTVPGKVTVIRMPAWAQPKVAYALAVVTRSPNQVAAKAYVKKVTGKLGQAQLAKFGFLPVTKPKLVIKKIVKKQH